MQPSALRVALFTGNYNYVRDGPTQAMNQLVGFLLEQGAAVRFMLRPPKSRLSRRSAILFQSHRCQWV